MIVLERYIQHSAKQEGKAQKQKLKEAMIAPNPMRSRSKSQSKISTKEENIKQQTGFIVRRNIKLSANYNSTEFRSLANKTKSSLLNVF